MIKDKKEKLDELEKEVTTKKRPFFSETKNIDKEKEEIEQDEEKKEQITPENFTSKTLGVDKEWTALIDAFFWYVAVCILLIPQLIPYINGWIIFGILATLLWTIYGGWIKRVGEIKAKKWRKKYEKANEDKEKATNKVNNLENKIIGLQDQVVTMKQRLEDGREIESKLIKNIDELTTVITKNVTKEN